MKNSSEISTRKLTPNQVTTAINQLSPGDRIEAVRQSLPNLSLKDLETLLEIVKTEHYLREQLEADNSNAMRLEIQRQVYQRKDSNSTYTYIYAYSRGSTKGKLMGSLFQPTEPHQYQYQNLPNGGLNFIDQVFKLSSTDSHQTTRTIRLVSLDPPVIHGQEIKSTLHYEILNPSTFQCIATDKVEFPDCFKPKGTFYKKAWKTEFVAPHPPEKISENIVQIPIQSVRRIVQKIDSLQKLSEKASQLPWSQTKTREVFQLVHSNGEPILEYRTDEMALSASRSAPTLAKWFEEFGLQLLRSDQTTSQEKSYGQKLFAYMKSPRSVQEIFNYLFGL